jgi:CBS-domain-containing membrane protein
MESNNDLETALLEAPPIAADRPLSGVIQAAARSDHPVPVVDNDGAFRGAVSHGQLLQTLTQKADRGH